MIRVSPRAYFRGVMLERVPVWLPAFPFARPPEKLLLICPECASWVHVAIERLASDAELGAKLAHIRAGLAHGCLSESQLRCGHLEWPSAVEPRAKPRRE